jgi:hypothetical protein
MVTINYVGIYTTNSICVQRNINIVPINQLYYLSGLN